MIVRRFGMLAFVVSSGQSVLTSFWSVNETGGPTRFHDRPSPRSRRKSWLMMLATPQIRLIHQAEDRQFFRRHRMTFHTEWEAHNHKSLKIILMSYDNTFTAFESIALSTSVVGIVSVEFHTATHRRRAERIPSDYRLRSF